MSPSIDRLKPVPHYCATTPSSSAPALRDVVRRRGEVAVRTGRGETRIDLIASNGATVDSFETSVPSLGGTQLNDVFRARSLSRDGEPVLIRITPLQGMIGAYAAMVDNATNDPTYFAANLAAK